MKEIIINLERFDLDKTLESGQIFGWKKVRDGWLGEIKRNVVLVKQKKKKLNVNIVWENKNQKLNKNDIIHYFSLDQDIDLIYSKIKTDETMKNAIKEFDGLRIIRQEEWPCLVSFIISAFSNIPRIEKNIEEIKRKHGTRIDISDKDIEQNEFYLFPTIEQIRKGGIETLKKCGLGFRDKYIHNLARQINYNKINEIRRMNYKEAKKELMKLDGVGEKVADCVLLFAFQRYEAFPIDVWIEKAMNEIYGEEMKFYFEYRNKLNRKNKLTSKKKFSYSEITEFARYKWNGYAGYAQQFLYEYIRKRTKHNSIRKND